MMEVMPLLVRVSLKEYCVMSPNGSEMNPLTILDCTTITGISSNFRSKLKSILTTTIARLWHCIFSGGSIHICGSSWDRWIKAWIGGDISGILYYTGRREIQMAFHQDPRPWSHQISRERNCFGNSIDHLLEHGEASVFKRLRWGCHSFNRVVAVGIKYTKVWSESFVLRCDQWTTCLSRAVEIFVDTDSIENKWRAIKMIGAPIAGLLVMDPSLKQHDLPNSWLIQDWNN